jgi:hypothetical protein
MFRAIGIALAGITMAFLSIAAMLKFADLPSFHHSLETWRLLPVSLRPLTAVLVPSVELIVSAAWLLGLERRHTPLAALVFLIIVTAVYAIHLALLPEAPTCRCLGALLAYQGAEHEASANLARNAVLMACLVGAIIVHRPRAPRRCAA